MLTRFLVLVQSSQYFFCFSWPVKTGVWLVNYIDHHAWVTLKTYLTVKRIGNKFLKLPRHNISWTLINTSLYHSKICLTKYMDRGHLNDANSKHMIEWSPKFEPNSWAYSKIQIFDWLQESHVFFKFSNSYDLFIWILFEHC